MRSPFAIVLESNVASKPRNRSIQACGVLPMIGKQRRGGRDWLLTVRQAADRLSAPSATVYKLIASGDPAHVRVSNAVWITPRRPRSLPRGQAQRAGCERGRKSVV